MRVGQRVMLVGSDGYMPPFGAIGVIVGALDWMGDHEVWFPDHPCPVGDESTWDAHYSWLMPIDPPAETHAKGEALLAIDGAGA